MNIFKRVLGHLYFIYALILFLATMLVALIPALIALLFSEPQRAKIIHPTYRIWMSIFLPLVFIRVERKGTHHFKKGKNYVVIVNHNSLMDIPVSMPWIPGPNKTLAKVEMTKIPLFGVIYRAGSVLVNRKDSLSKQKSAKEMQEVLALGLHMTLYPEGTRNKSKEPLQNFHNGAFITAILAKKDIIPGILFHTKDILPIAPKLWAWPHKIRFEFLPAIDISNYDISKKNDLKRKAFEMMKNYIIENK
ncbi:MAG TPA: lysophospholipid acyltransferase family protein [Edaphocola sp.]|nr:lysophospholipid acyltransferase family protein [Edaphocola sp.]